MLPLISVISISRITSGTTTSNVSIVTGKQIVTDTGGISGNNTIAANSKFNFFGADNNTTSYNINGQVIDAVIYTGQGVSGNFTPPTAPLIDSSGNINHYSGFSDSQLYFASPLVDVSGSDPNPVTDYITTGDNSFYLPLDGNTPIGEDRSVEIVTGKRNTVGNH